MNPKSYTDVIHQNFKVYIEGVQVPFQSISITSGYGGLPSANVTVPAQAGLMDIARFYSPKVHIFFSDRIGTYNESNPDDVKKRDKLIFSGLISQVAYSKSKNMSANIGLSFSCVHRYSLVDEMLVDYTGWLNADPIAPESAEPNAVKLDHSNSPASILEALTGITKKQDSAAATAKQEITYENPEGSASTLPSKYNTIFDRLIGMPGVVLNFWGQIKRAAFSRAMRDGQHAYSESFIKMYQPLVEEGVRFLYRIAGHYPLETLVQDDMYRICPCPATPDKQEKILIPPGNQLFLSSSIQAEMAYHNISSYMQNSGEVTTIYGIFSQFYDSIDYDLLTLASPAVPALYTQRGSAVSDARYPVDTIIKPKIPFYFSPTCNVLFPGMYTHLSVMYDEMNVPTRVKIKNMEGPGTEDFRTNITAPHSIRAAIAEKAAGRNGEGGVAEGKTYSLGATIGTTYGAIGLYEQGRGIKQQTTHMPRWLSHFSQSTAGASQPITDIPPDGATEPARVKALADLATGWAKRYPGSYYAPLNPYELKGSNISAHHRLLFTAADYSYTQAFARSKVGSVEGPFNPFITPGYPMDILEQNPLYPSFHAMCTSVTHTITAESVGTSIQFTGAMTYAELTNYYIPFVSPMIQVALKLATNPTLMGHAPDSEVTRTGDDFYRYTLGVPCVTPDMLMDINKMQIKPVKWNESGNAWTVGSSVSSLGPNGGEKNPMLTFEGNLSMAYREIENKFDIEKDFRIKFIDMTTSNYGPNVMRYKDDRLSESQKFEIGQNQFLIYNTYFGTPIEKLPTTTNVDGTVGTNVVTEETFGPGHH